MRRSYFAFPSAVSLLAAFLSSCAVGPDYKKPDVVVPPSWGWKRAEPRDEAIRGDWWKSFGDPALDRLEAEATSANQLVRTAMARVDQARAVARVTASRFYPQAALDPSISHFHTQQDHIPSELTATATTVPVDFSYEIDLWGKLRRAFESSRAQAEASAADFAQILLTLHGDVATDYFLLHQFDAQLEILQRAVDLRQTAVDLVKQRFEAGLAPELDVDRAQSELFQARTLITETQRQRALMQDALALLCGQPSPSFIAERKSLQKNVPSVPVGLPSALLERRPDIAEAERKMAAANAQIGVAKAAFFPAISLTGDAGYSSFHASTLLDWQSRLFQVGPGVALPILNGGRLSAGLKEARANYQAVCATYRQQVLVAFKEVSDSLADLTSYRRQAGSEAEAVSFAAKAASSSRERYKDGLVPYFDVLDSERTQLQTELQANQILGMQLVSTVHLIKALGGGFSAAPAS